MDFGTALAIFCGLVFGALAWVLPPSKLAILLAGLPAALVIMRWPAIGLVLFALASTFMPYSTLQVGFRFTVSEALLGLTWMGVAMHVFFQRIVPPQFDGAQKALIVLMLFSALPFMVGQFQINAPDSGISSWIRWLANLSPLFLGSLLLADARQREQVVVALLLGNLAMLLLSLAVFVRHRSALDMIPILEKAHYAHPEALQDIFSAENARLGTPWVHPNLTGGAMALFVPLAAFYAMVRSGWRRALGVAVAVLGVMALMLSSSRGAIVSLALVLSWLAWLQVPSARQLLLAGVVAGVVAGISYAPLQQRLSTIFSSDNASTQVRLDEYKRFPEAVRRYPLGIGFKTDPPVPGSGLLGISNLWLNYVYKIGLIGMLIYCVVLGHWWMRVRPRGKLTRIDESTGMWIGTTSAVAAALLTGLFDHYYSFTMVLVGLFWLMMALSLQSAKACADGGTVTKTAQAQQGQTA
jgi:hypothetical protein